MSFTYAAFSCNPRCGRYICPSCGRSNATEEDMMKTAGGGWRFCPVCGERVIYGELNTDYKRDFPKQIIYDAKSELEKQPENPLRSIRLEFIDSLIEKMEGGKQ